MAVPRSVPLEEDPNTAMEVDTNPQTPHTSRTPPFPPFMFFYGTLMDPILLKTVLGLQENPDLRKGTIGGFKMKIWGDIYPILIPVEGGKEEGGVLSGVVWKVDSKAHFRRLQQYETEAYAWYLCDVRLEDGEELRGCGTFCWAGGEDDSDLEDGTFDLQRYHDTFKPFRCS